MRPTERLRSYVASYSEYDMSGWPGGRHRGLPDGALNLVVSIDVPLKIRRKGQADLEATATISGLRAQPLDIVHRGCGQGVQIEITPPGSRALLGLPAAELANGVWPLDEVVGTRARELIERLLEQAGPMPRARALDAVLVGWVHDAAYPRVVDTAWHRLVASAGSVSVARLADEAGLSRRHLSEVLRAELGLTPKTVARVLRFARARTSLRSGRTATLAETAATCGYFDQAHLSNEWKRLAGCTPGQWIAEELPFLQDRDMFDDAS
ncbi:MAG: AraC family transcriptional regulator [Acidimicrobiales bacterium]|jgi:AraC-like DNA-binding protein